MNDITGYGNNARDAIAELEEALRSSEILRKRLQADLEEVRARCQRYERVLYPQSHEQADILDRAK